MANRQSMSVVAHVLALGTSLTLEYEAYITMLNPNHAYMGVSPTELTFEHTLGCTVGSAVNLKLCRTKMLCYAKYYAGLFRSYLCFIHWNYSIVLELLHNYSIAGITPA